MSKEIIPSISLTEKRAQELITEAAKQIMDYEASMVSIKEDIKAVKDAIKGEGINTKALNDAIKRYKAIQAGKQNLESDLSEADLYLEVLKENL